MTDRSRAVELNNLATDRKTRGDLDDAITYYRMALSEDKDYHHARINLAICVHAKNNSDWAEKLYLETQERDKSGEFTNQILYGLGCVNYSRGDVIRAQEYFRKHWQKFRDPQVASNLIICNLYLKDCSTLDESIAWGDRFTPLEDYHHQERDPGPLRVGYLSPDFRNHPVAKFIEPVLLQHSANLDLWCFSTCAVHEQDETTERIRSMVDDRVPRPDTRFQDYGWMNHEQIVEAIRSLRLDVLVDLAGHTANNRLQALGCRLAPVQVTYLGYPGTTGVRAMDYRLSDCHSELPGTNAYSEDMRMLDCGWCFQEPHHLPKVNDTIPLETNGFVTFGSFNNVAKIQDTCLGLWAYVLKEVSSSKLMLKGSAFDKQTESGRQTCNRIRGELRSRGIERNRVYFCARVPDAKEALDSYNQVDIALDTYPYCGTTTTCEAAIMGVPTITLTGRYHHARVGHAISKHLGVSQLLSASTPEDYAAKAVRLASDPVMLKNLKLGLRNDMRHSALMDGHVLACQLEDFYYEAANL